MAHIEHLTRILNRELFNCYSNSELEEMGIDPEEIEAHAQAAYEEATACMCSDPLCPCVKRWQIP